MEEAYHIGLNRVGFAVRDYSSTPPWIFDIPPDETIINKQRADCRVFASSIIRLSFDSDFYNPDFTWALRNVYLCTVIERNMAEFIADLPATFALARGLHKKAQTVLSRETGGSGKGYIISGNSGSLAKGFPKPSRRPEYSTNNESTYQDDEILLNGLPQAPVDNMMITMRTSIDMQAHTVGTQEQEHTRREIVRPWDKMQSNV